MSRQDDVALESSSPEEWLDLLDRGEVTLETLFADDDGRRRLIQYLVDSDIEEHREIYDRLAES